MTYAVIMAGGIGTRFWPMSRRKRPKQFLEIVDNHTLIQNTVARLQGIILPEQCFVVTHERYVDETSQQIPVIPRDNILPEPIGRNTAPCITFAAIKLLEKDPDATMVILPADHVIRNVQEFQKILQVGIDAAQEYGALLTIGIEPTHPATGYGYIQYDSDRGPDNEEPRSYWVKTFAEKPNLATAERFLDSGDFLWNSGMFVWRADTIMDAVQKHLPRIAEAFSDLPNHIGKSSESTAIREAYAACPSISIDYGVMERADKVYVVPASFDWSDVGDWRAVYDLQEKGKNENAISGNAIVHNANGCLVCAGERLIVLVGMDDAIVVDTEDATLVCGRESTQQVKNVVDYLYTHGLDAFV